MSKMDEEEINAASRKYLKSNLTIIVIKTE